MSFANVEYNIYCHYQMPIFSSSGIWVVCNHGNALQPIGHPARRGHPLPDRRPQHADQHSLGQCYRPGVLGHDERVEPERDQLFVRRPGKERRGGGADRRWTGGDDRDRVGKEQECLPGSRRPAVIGDDPGAPVMILYIVIHSSHWEHQA